MHYEGPLQIFILVVQVQASVEIAVQTVAPADREVDFIPSGFKKRKRSDKHND